MPAVATQADALRISIGGTDVAGLRIEAEPPGIAGVIPLVAADRNGPGTGMLTLSADASTLAWRAPGSATDGVPVSIPQDGNYLLADGEDRDMWLRVQIVQASLPGGGGTSRLKLKRRYDEVAAGGDPTIGNDDVTAGEATAGDVLAYTATMTNAGPTTLSDLRVWIDASVSGLEISDDGATWVAPTTEATALQFPDLAAGGTDTLHLRRTIGAGASADPDVLSQIHVAYNSL